MENPRAFNDIHFYLDLVPIRHSDLNEPNLTRVQKNALMYSDEYKVQKIKLRSKISIPISVRDIKCAHSNNRIQDVIINSLCWKLVVYAFSAFNTFCLLARFVTTCLCFHCYQFNLAQVKVSFPVSAIVPLQLNPISLIVSMADYSQFSDILWNIHFFFNN